jgi:hypothetical protein
MTRYSPLWQQGGSYAASTDRGLFSTLWPSGGVIGGAVTAVANTMTVSVAPGTAAVVLQAGQGTALCRWDAAEVPPALAASPPSGQSRIDVIVAQVRDNALDAGGNNDFVFATVTGTPATTGTQTVPATPVNAYAMANVTVPGAAANLNAATITDRRSGPLALGNRRLKAYSTANQSLVASTATTITYAAFEYNTAGSDMNLGTGVFTASVAGLYRVSAQLLTTVPLGGNVVQVYASLFKNGAEYMRGDQIVLPTGAGSPNPGVGFYAEVNLAVGDTLAALLYSAVGANTIGGAPYVSFTVSLIGPT